MKNKTLAFLMLVISLFSIAPAVLADGTTNYDITFVGVDDQDASSTVWVERGSVVPIEVYMLGTGDVKDVNIRAWLGGYEYNDVQVTHR